MARRARRVTGGEEFSQLLNAVAGDTGIEVARAGVYAGAGVLADAVKAEIRDLPEQEGYMAPGYQRNVISSYDKSQLEQHMGISHIYHDGDKASAYVGFAGYTDKPTKKFPQGVPVPLLARSLESGSSVRRKNSFVRRAYNKSKTAVQAAAAEAGQRAMDEGIKRNGG